MRPRTVSLSLLLWALAAAALAQGEAPDETSDPVDGATYEGWYVVRPGDTLQGITARYLGSADRWRENWRLNPEIADPDRLEPGDRLRILLRRLPLDGALVTRVSNRVEDQMPPRSWNSTAPHTVLRPRDGVRTFESSSAALRFGDETELRVSEESLIFLDRQPVVGRGASATREQIEIVRGQADLSRDATDRARASDEIEVVIGTAVARPRSASGGVMASRARKAETAAQLMVYAGESLLASGGVEIDVPEGMGSAAEEGAPPVPPEALLGAPAAERPAAGDRLANPRPTFSWQPVEGADAYTVEICRDAGCGALVQRRVLADAGAAAWRPDEKLPVADLHWRVTARSPSGLDGYPSETVPFAVTSDHEDVTPPDVSFLVDGPNVPPRPHLNERWILGPGGAFVAVAEDAGSGVERVVMELDGREVDPGEWRGPWTPGEHVLAFTALDRAGQEGRHDAIPIVYDVEPPRMTWGLEGVGRRGEVATRQFGGEREGWPVPKVKRRVELDDPHSWLPWRKQRWTVFHDGRHVVIRPERPLRLRLGDSFGATEPVLLGPERGLWVQVHDAVCGDDFELEHRVGFETERRDGEKRTFVRLEIRAVDAVGNGALAELSMSSAEASKEDRRSLEEAGREDEASASAE